MSWPIIIGTRRTIDCAPTPIMCFRWSSDVATTANVAGSESVLRARKRNTPMWSASQETPSYVATRWVIKPMVRLPSTSHPAGITTRAWNLNPPSQNATPHTEMKRETDLISDMSFAPT